jgi:hypothetical protein
MGFMELSIREVGWGQVWKGPAKKMVMILPGENVWSKRRGG